MSRWFVDLLEGSEREWETSRWSGTDQDTGVEVVVVGTGGLLRKCGTAIVDPSESFLIRVHRMMFMLVIRRECGVRGRRRFGWRLCMVHVADQLDDPADDFVNRRVRATGFASLPLRLQVELFKRVFFGGNVWVPVIDAHICIQS